jgi:hypothetical protein
MFDSELSIRGAGPRTWELTMPLIWTGTKGDTFVVPTGFVTDFASVPRFLHWLVSPYGAYTRAAVLHDWLLVSLAEWDRERKHGGPSGLGNPDLSLPGRQPPANSRDADGIFRRVMHDLGVPWSTRWLMWAAVRAAALFNPRRAYGRQFAKDAPRVLAVALLAIPVALPGALGVIVSLGLARVLAPFPARPVAQRPAGLSRRDS